MKNTTDHSPRFQLLLSCGSNIYNIYFPVIVHYAFSNCSHNIYNPARRKGNKGQEKSHALHLRTKYKNYTRHLGSYPLAKT